MVRRKIISIWSVLLILVLALAVFVPGCNGTPPTTGTIEVDATLDGSPWPSSGTGAVEYTLTVAGGSPTNGSEVPKTFTDMDAGDWTCAYVSGGPGTFVDITTAATQNLAAEDTITFTLNFVTPATLVDAYITFDTWTINGNPVEPGFHWVYPDDVVDARYKEGVAGNNTGQEVRVKETLMVSYHWQGIEGEQAPAKSLHVVNAWGAVWGVPPFEQKLSQTATFNGQPVTACTHVDCPFCDPQTLDVEIETVQKVGTNYTKNVNWIKFKPSNGEPMTLQSLDDYMFEDDTLIPWQQCTLTSWACIEVGEGFEDTNPANDCCAEDPSTSITLMYQPPPP
jgi:hypothetical protein